jgi:hypothetical protein
MDLTIALSIGIAATVSGLIVAVKARLRMRKSLGRRVSDLDLVSYRTWNQVQETEQRNAESGPIHPR